MEKLTKIPMYDRMYRGEPLAIINSIYHPRKSKDKADNKEDMKDILEIVYKNMDTGEKFIESYKEPLFRFFKCKEPQSYPKEFVSFQEVNEHICKYSEREIRIAETFGDEWKNKVYDFYRNRTAQYAMQIHQMNTVFTSDESIEEFARIELGLYTDLDHLNYGKMTKAYFDIEVDLIDEAHRELSIEELKEYAPAPINMITTIYEKEKLCVVQVLDTKNNKSYSDFMNDAKAIEDFKADILSSLADIDIDDIKIIPYTDEIKMISQYFDFVNYLKPDIMTAWNISFDIKYIIQRLKTLGLEYPDIMKIVCHPDFQKKSFYYHDDTRATSMEEKMDWFRGSTYTIYLCQMLTWIHTRKGRQLDVANFSLDSIGEFEVGEGKHDYSSYGTIYTIAHNNFPVALKYNIIDVKLLKKIEDKTKDITSLFMQATATCTLVRDVFKKTVFIKNAIAMYLLSVGLCYENNRNKNYTENLFMQDSNESEGNNIGERKDKFQGAVVGDPTLNLPRGIALSPSKDKFNSIIGQIENLLSNPDMINMMTEIDEDAESKMSINQTKLNKEILGLYKEAITTDRSRWIFRNIIDFDLTSLYPSIIRAFNISKMSQIGKVVIPDQVSDMENPYGEERYNRGGDFIDDYECGDILFIGRKWFNLPSVKEMIDELKGEDK